MAHEAIKYLRAYDLPRAAEDRPKQSRQRERGLVKLVEAFSERQHLRSRILKQLIGKPTFLLGVYLGWCGMDDNPVSHVIAAFLAANQRRPQRRCSTHALDVLRSPYGLSTICPVCVSMPFFQILWVAEMVEKDPESLPRHHFLPQLLCPVRNTIRDARALNMSFQSHASRPLRWTHTHWPPSLLWQWTRHTVRVSSRKTVSRVFEKIMPGGC